MTPTAYLLLQRLVNFHPSERIAAGIPGELTLVSTKGGSMTKWHTLELPWRDNKRRVSCIPKKHDYQVKRRESGSVLGWHVKHGIEWLPEIEKVEGRTHILFHAGNKVSPAEDADSLGCILLSNEPATWDGSRWWLPRSMPAVVKFVRVLDVWLPDNDARIKLHVVDRIKLPERVCVPAQAQEAARSPAPAPRAPVPVSRRDDGGAGQQGLLL